MAGKPVSHTDHDHDDDHDDHGDDFDCVDNDVLITRRANVTNVENDVSRFLVFIKAPLFVW